MRIPIILFTAFFGITANVLSAADSFRRYDDDEEPVRSQPGSTSSYKVKMAVTYPDSVPDASPSDILVGQGYAGGDANSDSYARERERVRREELALAERLRAEREQEELERRERVNRDRIEREQAERERIEHERRVERERLEREQKEQERQDLERRERERLLEAERLEQEKRERDQIALSKVDRTVSSATDGLRVERATSTYTGNGITVTANDAPLVTIDEFPTDSLQLQSEPEPVKPEPKVLATLYGTPITEEDVAREMWLRRGRETFDWLIGRDILRRELDRLDLRVTDSEVRECLDRHLDVLRKAYPKLRKRDELTRAASGMTLEEYRERTVWSELALRKIMRVNLETRDEDLRKYFASVRADYIRPERVRISQIFIPPQTEADSDGIADAEAWRRAEVQIQDAHALLRRQNFSDVARTFGSGSHISRWVKRGDLLRELEGPAFSINAGSITTPIKSSMGWHMIMVEEREERREPTLGEVREEVLARYEEERFVRLAGEFMSRLKEQALGAGSLVMVDIPGVFAESTPPSY